MSVRLVAVVGAGVAGLSCAQRLRRAGRHVVLFDKGRRPGGRVSTRRAEQLRFDHGAQFFTARDPRFAELVARLERDGAVARWQGPFATLRDGERGDDPRRDAVRYVGTPGMSGLARALAADLDVRVGVRVDRVLRNGDGFVLELQPHGDDAVRREGPFDEVVVTAPPRQAAELLRDVDGDARLAAEQQSGALMPSLCAMVAFERPLPGADGGMFVLDDEVLGWAAHDGGKPGRGGAWTYVLHGAAVWSLANYERPAADYAADLLAAFGRALAIDAAAMPAPTHLTGHRWGYALAAGEPPAQPFVLQPDGLAVCGDWLGGGRVEGAFVSGLELGDALSCRS